MMDYDQTIAKAYDAARGHTPAVRLSDVARSGEAIAASQLGQRPNQARLLVSSFLTANRVLRWTAEPTAEEVEALRRG
jgi:hypothetical protein